MISNQIIKNIANNAIDSNGDIDKKIAEFVLTNLNKKELKLFITRLKKVNNQKIVKVKYEGTLTQEIKKSIEEMYKGKKISYENDKNLGGGIIIIDNDMIVNYTIDGLIEKRLEVI